MTSTDAGRFTTQFEQALKVSARINRRGQDRCEQAEQRIKDYQLSLGAHKKAMALLMENFNQRVPNQFKKGGIERVLKESLEKKEISQENQAALDWINPQMQTIFKGVLQEYLPDLDRVALNERFKNIKDLLKGEIQNAKSLVEKDRAKMIQQVEATKLVLPDEPTPELSSLNQALRDSVTSQICGMGFNGESQQIEAFNFSIQEKRYVILCPGILLFYLQSPVGLDGMAYMLTHELGHSIDTVSSLNIRDGTSLGAPDFSRSYRSLTKCWDQSIGRMIKTPEEFLKSISYVTAIKQYKRLFEIKKAQLQADPNAVEMHSHEMVGDYWGIRVAQNTLSKITDASKQSEFVTESLIVFCGGNEVDDGYHLPNSVRFNWILDQLEPTNQNNPLGCAL